MSACGNRRHFAFLWKSACRSLHICLRLFDCELPYYQERYSSLFELLRCRSSLYALIYAMWVYLRDTKDISNAGYAERYKLRKSNALESRCSGKGDRDYSMLKQLGTRMKPWSCCTPRCNYKLPITTMNLNLPSPFFVGIDPGAGGESSAAPFAMNSSSMRVLLFQPQL